ncbi:MAG: 50S ribosomal protein L28, partial [Clostridiales bacterium]|nr:50S ribosomal protein L28 [Clostridiales bacterium]
VSHSHKKTKRTFNANVHKGTVVIDGEEQYGYVCTRCLRTAKKQEN